LIGSLVLKVGGAPDFHGRRQRSRDRVRLAALGPPVFRTHPPHRLVHELGGLNIFIAIVGISAGPGFVNG
jgi:hypothetical protein